MDRFLRVWLLPLAVLGTTFSNAAVGARVPKPPSADMRASLGTVAVVAGHYLPQSNFTAFAKGQGRGAAKNVAEAITRALLATKPSSTLAEDLLKTLATETAVPIRSADTEGPGSPGAEPSYKSLRAQGVDTVLEVAVTSVGLEGGKHTPLITFFMDVGTRLIRVADNEQRYSGVFRYSGRAATLDMWIADNGRLLREQFTQGYERLADRITTDLFLLTSMKLRWELSDSMDLTTFTCWLGPIYPGIEISPARTNIRFSPGFFLGSRTEPTEPAKLLFPVLDSLRPQLNWEMFPRGEDAERHLPISDVRYDLRIWKVDADYPGPLVYDREGLPEPYHQLEVPLEPGTQYFWSVRARFKRNGRLEVTPWAFSAFFMPNGCKEYEQIPSTGYFRFVTPKVVTTVASTASPPYRIAVFPFGGDTPCTSYNRSPAVEIATDLAALIKRNGSLMLAYSYYDKHLNQPPIEHPDQLWKGPKPDVERVSTLGEAHSVDAVVMYWRPDSSPGLSCSNRQPPYPIKVCLVDVKRRRLYQLQGIEEDHKGMTEQVLSGFLASVKPGVKVAIPK